MKKIVLMLIAFIIVGICVPAVSAETIVDELIYVSEDTSTSTGAYGPGRHPTTQTFTQLKLTNIQNRQNLGYVGFVFSGNSISGTALSEGQNDLMYTFNGQTKPCRIYITHQKNFLGSITSTKMLIFFDDWDIGTLTGTQTIKFSAGVLRTSSSAQENDGGKTPNAYWDYIGGSYLYYPNTVQSVSIASYVESQNHLNVDLENGMYSVTLTRNYPPVSYPSRFEAVKDETVLFYNEDAKNLNTAYLTTEIDTINVILGSKTFTFPLNSGGGAADSTVTVYVQNSQTGALLANAHINISASVNGNLHEIINETIPGGIATYTLQPTGGGMPNPDFYRLIPTAEGYNSIMPYIDFEVGGETTIYAILDPIGGAPEDENHTFIDFYVRDMSAKPISGATVNFGGYILITNSAGYTIFEVDKSKNYSWTVSKSGYGSLTGNAVIGAAPRHTINTVLAPAVTPTTPTTIPTSTSIIPTPTMTAPTGEPTSNLLEWFAAHFGMILGGGVEIGKIFMWLCFAVPVGVYVGKEAKAGAAGFMAGAGIVTLFFVLIGWVPIWLLVLLALVIGLLYAKVFNAQDNGGGR